MPGGLLLLGAVDRLSGLSPFVSERQAPRRAAPKLSTAPAAGRPTPKRPAAVPISASRAARAARQPPKRVLAEQSPTSTATLKDALKAADRGELDLAIGVAQSALQADPLDSEANFILGVAELAREAPREAIDPLRRALYIDPNFSLAAFNLARAHDALGEQGAAKRAYERTLRTLDHSGAQEQNQSDRLDLLDIATACRARLRTIRALISLDE